MMLRYELKKIFCSFGGTVFGKVYRTVDLCIPLYILLTILLIPIMYREYKTKQVL